jgi:hypothetical protein
MYIRVALFCETIAGKNFIAEHKKSLKENGIKNIDAGNLIRLLTVCYYFCPFPLMLN